MQIKKELCEICRRIESKEECWIDSKKRAAPIQLLGLEAIMRWSKYVTDEMRSAMSKRQIGFKGECSIDYYLDQLTHFMILHDLRLPAKPYRYVQIDSFTRRKIKFPIPLSKPHANRINWIHFCLHYQLALMSFIAHLSHSYVTHLQGLYMQRHSL